MPSIFPGMDPFIEGQKWRNFHARMIVAIGDALVPQLAPRYVVDVEESVYLQSKAEDARYPDVSVSAGDFLAEPAEPSTGATATATEPKIYTIPDTAGVRQRHLEIRQRDSQRLVTAIEVLSPTNKSDGYRQYLQKRDEFFAAGANLVELDLLRGGKRLPTVEPLEAADYFAFVCRHEQLPQVNVYLWTLRKPLPRIPIPLAGEDPDAWIELQSLLDEIYDRAGFAYSLNYSNPTEPPLTGDSEKWALALLKQSR